MHKIDYHIQLTNSKLFDTLMYSAALKVCGKFPGLLFLQKLLQIFDLIPDLKTALTATG